MTTLLFVEISACTHPAKVVTFVDEQEYAVEDYQADNDLTIAVINLTCADYFVPLTGLHYNIYIYMYINMI